MPNPEHMMIFSGVLSRVTEDPDTPDRYGNPTRTTTTEPVPKLWLFETGTSENTVGDNTVIRAAEIWFPVGFNANHIDSIAVNGDDWTFTGAVVPRTNARTGQVVYVEAKATCAK